ncbi:O-methyltransferase family protein [Peptoniphilus sp. ING2-D1G]|nr:O-methyltransferase family protein [Peptoniphilus sp. ING2-D1G]
MTNINYEYIEDYIRNLIDCDDEKLIEMRNFADENFIPIIEKESEEFVKFLISMHKPEKILELGTAIGYSAIIMAKTSENIKLLRTIEIKDSMVNVAKKNVETYGLGNIIEIIKGDAYEYLKTEKENFDFIFIDAAKGQYEKYFDVCIGLLNKNGIILCDNVLFRGMIANQNLVKRRKITIVKRLRKFLKRIKSDKNYISTIIPIGDGMILIRRANE